MLTRLKLIFTCAFMFLAFVPAKANLIRVYSEPKLETFAAIQCSAEFIGSFTIELSSDKSIKLFYQTSSNKPLEKIVLNKSMSDLTGPVGIMFGVVKPVRVILNSSLQGLIYMDDAN